MTIAYTDYKNYPHGFRRSGDYSIKEAERIEKFGHLLQQLASAQKKPTNAQEKSYVAQLSGKAEVTDPEVAAWIKYQKKISESKQYFPLCSTPSEDEVIVKKSAIVDDVDGGDGVDGDVDVDVDVDGAPGEDDDLEIEET